MPLPNFALDQEEGRRRFLAWLAHELRNPLAAITGAVQLLRNNAVSEADARELYEMIWRQTMTIQATVEELPRLSAQISSNSSDGDVYLTSQASPEFEATPFVPDKADGMLTVLVIDDQRDVRLPAERLLTQAGFRVFAASDGAAGIDLARQVNPDVVLCDISLPDCDGYEVARRLVNHPGASHRHYIAITGYDDDGERKKAMAAGYQQFLVKPIDYATLIDQLSALAASRS